MWILSWSNIFRFWISLHRKSDEKRTKRSEGESLPVMVNKLALGSQNICHCHGAPLGRWDRCQCFQWTVGVRRGLIKELLKLIPNPTVQLTPVKKKVSKEIDSCIALCVFFIMFYVDSFLLCDSMKVLSTQFENYCSWLRFPPPISPVHKGLGTLMPASWKRRMLGGWGVRCLELFLLVAGEPIRVLFTSSWPIKRMLPITWTRRSRSWKWKIMESTPASLNPQAPTRKRYLCLFSS